MSLPLEVGVHYIRACLPFFDPVGGAGFGGDMFEGLFQPMHLLIIFFIALLVFGPKKLPELGKGLGDGIRALKEGMKDHSQTAATTPATTPEVKPEPKVETKSEARPVITPENNPENKA
jgi:sec-independent protein translocase protein TatA